MPKREKLTDNNQIERAVASQAEYDASLTTNTDQPNRRFSDGQPPAPQPPPENATTGCTTLPPFPVPTPEELPQDHQSVNDYPWTPQQEEAIRRNHQKVFGTPPEEKDPPAPGTVTTNPAGFTNPEERVVPTTLEDQVLALTAQNQMLAAENERLSFQNTLHDQTITDLRGANTQILRRNSELQDKNRQLAKERHALAAALQLSNETIQTAIEKIASLLRVIK